MKLSKGLTVFALGTMVAAGFASANVVSADSVSDAKSAVSANKTASAKLLAQVQSASAKVDKLNNQVSNKIVAIDKANDDITSATKKIASYKGQIKEAAAEVTTRKTAMVKQLRSLQKQAGDSVSGNVYVDFVLNSKNIGDMVSRAFTVNKLSEANKDALNSVKEAKTKLANLEADQEQQKTTLVNTKEQLVNDKAKLVSLKADAQSSQSSLQKKLSDNKAELASLESSLSDATAAAEAVKATTTATASTKAATTTTSTTTANAASSSSSTASSSSSANSSSSSSSASSVGASSGVVAVAKQYLGVPYVYGGSTPSGFDCSGFVQYVERKMGVSLPRTSQAMSTVGSYVSVSNLQVGDLVFWGGVGSAYHVGIYIGGNSYIHAPEPGESVCVQSISWYRPSFGRRI